MGHTVRAIETAGTIGDQRHLVLDGPQPIAGPTRVRIIMLLPEKGDMDDAQRLTAAAANPAFDFLKEPEEDISTVDGGKLFNHQG